jgi:hypothetical protein
VVRQDGPRPRRHDVAARHWLPATLALTCEGKSHGLTFEMETLRDVSAVMQTAADWVARNAVVTE